MVTLSPVYLNSVNAPGKVPAVNLSAYAVLASCVELLFADSVFVVQLSRVPLAGVPSAGVTSVGLVANTKAPVPVSLVTAASKFALVGVPRNV